MRCPWCPNPPARHRVTGAGAGGTGGEAEGADERLQVRDCVCRHVEPGGLCSDLLFFAHPISDHHARVVGAPSDQHRAEGSAHRSVVINIDLPRPELRLELTPSRV